MIKENMYKEIGLLKKNQKPKINIKEGIIYILCALNTNSTLYKIRRTKNLKNRMNQYNSGNANDIITENLFNHENFKIIMENEIIGSINDYIG
jgi:hypothetical protein